MELRCLVCLHLPCCAAAVRLLPSRILLKPTPIPKPSPVPIPMPIIPIPMPAPDVVVHFLRRHCHLGWILAERSSSLNCP